MSKIFVSYSRSDEKFVDALAADLDRKGLGVYYDKRLKPGEDFEEILSKKLEGAKYVLVVLSPDSLNSRNVRRELEHSIRRERKGQTTVIPLLVRPCDRDRLRMFLGPKQYADFTKGYEAGLEELLTVLAEPVQSASELDVSDKVGKRKAMAFERKTQIIVALISGAVALIIAYWQFIYKPSHPAPDEKASYQGRVIDIDSKQIIDGAKISIEANGVPPNVYTDANGVFHLELSGAPTSVRVRVEKTGYKPFDEFVPLTKDKFEDIRLTPNDSAPTPNASGSPANRKIDNSTKDNRPPALRSTESNLERRRKIADSALNYSSPTPRPNPTPRP